MRSMQHNMASLAIQQTDAIHVNEHLQLQLLRDIKAKLTGDKDDKPAGRRRITRGSLQGTLPEEEDEVADPSQISLDISNAESDA